MRCSTQLRGCPRSYLRSSHFVATAKLVVTISLETPRSGGEERVGVDRNRG